MMEERKHERNQFTFYSSFFDAVQGMPKRVQAQVIMAIIVYGLDREEIPMDGLAKGLFALIRPVLDSGWRKALATRHGGGNGRLGVESKWNQNEIKKEKEIEIENEIEIEKEGKTATRHAARGRRRLDEDERRAVEALLRGDY